MNSRLTRSTVNTALRVLSMASLVTAAATARSMSLDQRNSTEATGERFRSFLERVTSLADSSAKEELVKEYLRKLREHGRAVIEDTTVVFLYHGAATRVGVPSDLNGWSAAADSMKRIEGTQLFFLEKNVEPATRFEYKLAVDSMWILDPINQQQAIGGYGPNSEIWMPRYAPPREVVYRDSIAHGRLDSLSFKSALLKRTHPVFVYLPPGYRSSHKKYPTLYVTDGGEYITLALMLNVLDNLIADKRIEPIVAVFVDPRTNIRDAATSTRMFDYSLSDTFVNALATELRPKLLKRYRMDPGPDNTGIMGASLGGLISAYAAYTRPDVFGLAACQSPAFWWKDDAIIKLITKGPKKPVKFYIDTGTIRDAQEGARRMKGVLDQKGYQVKYAEHPEGHNWVNWRARLDDILEYFWGTR